MSPVRSRPAETHEDSIAGFELSYWVSTEGLRKLFLRMIAGLAIGAVTFGGYLLLQRVEIRPVYWVAQSPLEKWITLSNSAPVVYLYLSFYHYPLRFCNS